MESYSSWERNQARTEMFRAIGYAVWVLFELVFTAWVMYHLWTCPTLNGGR